MARASLSPLLLSLLLLSPPVQALSYKLWNFDIDNGPAPSPEDSVPFSRNASRDRSLLPYQIVAIVCTYFGFVLILVTVLLTAGRTLRIRALNMAARPVEMVKRSAKQFDESPMSPASNRRWYARAKLTGKKSTGSMRSHLSAASPGAASIASFDTTVIEADRMRRQDEMERLYAAVMAQDTARDQAEVTPGGDQYPEMDPPEYSRGYPPRMVNSSLPFRQSQSSEQASDVPMSPKSPIRAIYPPESALSWSQTPTSPLRTEYTQSLNPFPASSSQAARQPSHMHTSSVGLQKSVVSTPVSQSGRRLQRRSSRNLTISAPMPTQDVDDGARTPLTPRVYTDPGIPPEPPTARTFNSEAPLNESYPENRSDDEDSLDGIADLPRPHPSHPPAVETRPARRLPPQISTTGLPTSPSPVSSNQSRMPKPSTATAGINNPLPFRQMASQQNRPQEHFPLSPTTWNRGAAANNFSYPASAGPTKTTFLEAKSTRLGIGTPLRTGMATPYSPYMPFTPLTPLMTPRLPTRAERKQREKEARKMKGALTEDDTVKEDDELWGSGY